MVQKIGVFILVTFAIIALVREPDAVAAFINAIGAALQTILATLAQLFDLMLVGDFVSLHSAVEQGVDPGPVPTIAEIEARISRA